MEVLANNPREVSECGQYFSYCTLDGQLKVWDTLSGRLKQEYTPSSHLSATCVTISWPDRHLPAIDESNDVSPKKKRKRNASVNVSQEVHDLELIALGTVNGNILLYSVVKSDLHSELSGGHEDRVNDMSWLTTNDSLFSCSNDKQVIEWSISTKKVKKKWSPDKTSVSAVCAIDSINVLIAGNSIKWLDWEKKTVLRHFSGHASEVQRLRHVWLPDSQQVLGSYFLSTAVGDRLISAWQLKPDGKQKSTASLASFSLDDETISLDISSAKPNFPIIITAVTKSGFLYIFEHILNGHRKTPITHKKKVQISTPNRKKFSSKQLMILSAQVLNDNEILIIYGSLLTPFFERINYQKLEKDTNLVRNDFNELSKPSLLVDSGFTKIKSPLKPKNATVVGPAGMAPTRQANNHNNNITIDVLNNVSNVKKESKPKQQNETYLTFEDRLRLTDTKPDADGSGSSGAPHEMPSSDSLTHVLVQGLQSKDKLMLETVFRNSDEKLIQNTLKKLPIDCISMLLTELQSCLFNKSEQTMVYLKWLEQLIQIRLTFLMTLPNIEEEFGPLLELLNARTHVLDRIYRLKGRLDLMVSQIRTKKSTECITRKIPQIVYETSESESSDTEEEDIIDDEFKDEDIGSDSDNDNPDDQQSSAEDGSGDEDNLMSEDNDEEYESNINDFETD